MHRTENNFIFSPPLPPLAPNLAFPSLIMALIPLHQRPGNHSTFLIFSQSPPSSPCCPVLWLVCPSPLMMVCLSTFSALYLGHYWISCHSCSHQFITLLSSLLTSFADRQFYFVMISFYCKISSIFPFLTRLSPNSSEWHPGLSLCLQP